jgi:hypothetical protein
MHWPSLAFALVAIGLGACSGEEPVAETTGPLMRPGEDCLSCHSQDSGRGAPVWSAAGTVYAQADADAHEGVAGADVLLSNPDGSLITKLTTNSVGNFYTPLPLPRGYRIALEYEGERVEMPCSPPGGLCNFCHGATPAGRALGRIRIPQGADSNAPPFDCSNF